MNKDSKRKTVIPKAGDKYFYHYPQLVVVVGVKSGEKVNFIPVAWNTCLSYTPFLYGISIGQERFTHRMLHQSNSFTVNFLSYDHIRLVRSLGRSSGAEMDKEKEFCIDYVSGKKTGAPIMVLAYCTFECSKQGAWLFGDHTLFVGEIVAIEINENAMNDDKSLNIEIFPPFLYMGIDDYITTDNKSRVSLKDLPFHYKTKIERDKNSIKENK